jgi:hypothetical protein
MSRSVSKVVRMPIEAAIARVAVEAHRHRFGVVRSRADWIAGAVLR